MDASDSSPTPRGLHRLFNLLHRLPTSDRLLLHFLIAVVIASGIWLLLSINNHFASYVPVTGGTIIEGVLGTPRYINPVLANSRADRDMTALIYDGVLMLDTNGELQPHLASEVVRSEDGLTYSITLREDIRFHDGTPLTATDVAFTYNLIKNPDLKSPLRGAWNNVNVTQIDDYRLEITLSEPYAPFIENLKVGILPHHIWSGVAALEMPFHIRNTDPIGSGPYRIDRIDRAPNGVLHGYQLQTHSDSVRQSYADVVYVRFFSTENEVRTALLDGSITSSADIDTSYLQQFTNDGFEIITTPLPRVFGVFFNQNRNPALRSQAVRQALSMSVDRETIITDVTHNYYIPTQSPVPRLLGAIESSDVSEQALYQADREAAITLLEDDGWELNDDGLWEKEINDELVPLSITLRTSEESPYDAVAERVRSDWEALGVEVRVELYEQPDFVDGIARLREFEAIVFGIDMGRGFDLYPFWHSSQQSDPGLNLSQFASIAADQQLQILRVSDDMDARRTAQAAIVEILSEEVPAFFLFTPVTNHVRRADIAARDIPTLLTESSDRLRFITSWHKESDMTWPLFHTYTNVIQNHDE